MCALAADPALSALHDRDAYVSPRVLGTDAPAQERRLIAAAAKLNDARRPVKLAVVAGPIGAPSLQVYVRSLRNRLHYSGTLIVTTRGRSVAASGTRTTADMTRALRAARVGRIADPVNRLARAASVAAPPAEDLEKAGRRSVLVLVVLALLGGGWAAALGAGRHGRHLRRQMTETRARTRICTDALRAHAMALARRPGLPDDARQHVQRALGVYSDAISSIPEMRSTHEVAAFTPRLRAALDDISAATAAVTGEPVQTDPFAGLCGIDPAHGAAVVPAHGDTRALCEACRDALARGEALAPRMLYQGGRAVPFDTADYGPVLRPGRDA